MRQKSRGIFHIHNLLLPGFLLKFGPLVVRLSAIATEVDVPAYLIVELTLQPRLCYIAFVEQAEAGRDSPGHSRHR
jgi:hypothetical protein